MRIIVLHWHGVCPHCGKLSCIYVDYWRDDDGIKMPNGFECGSCGQNISDEEFEKIEKLEIDCPKEK